MPSEQTRTYAPIIMLLTFKSIAFTIQKHYV